MKTPRMTRQHFEYIADLLQCTWPHTGATELEQAALERHHAYLIREMATALYATNPRFDRDRFELKATG